MRQTSSLFGRHAVSSRLPTRGDATPGQVLDLAADGLPPTAAVAEAHTEVNPALAECGGVDVLLELGQVVLPAGPGLRVCPRRARSPTPRR